MEALIIVLLVVLLAVVLLAVWLLIRRSPDQDTSDAERRAQQAAEAQLRLEQQLATLKTELTQKVDASQRTVLDQVRHGDSQFSQRIDAMKSDMTQSLTAAGETMGRVDRQLGELGESAKRIMDVGRDVSSLRDVLQPPKLRGGFGELLLEQLVKQVLPPDNYGTQHRFRDNTIVDLVIRTPEGLVPVDSKFPIESFRRLLEADGEDERAKARRAFVRDVKLRIDEVAKYIRPDDGTLDFALMYVPAENVYYETIAGTEDESPMTYALSHNVHLCSPNTFHAFLQVVLRGFRGMKVQEEAKEIMTRLAYFKREFAKFSHEFAVLGNHLGHAKNKFDELDKQTDRLGDKLEIEVSVQQPLPEPRELAQQVLLPQPTTVNGSDDSE